MDNVKRRMLQAVARVEHRNRHNSTLRRGRIDKSTAHKPRSRSWWGKVPQWYAGGTPPRLHNRVTPLVDGEHFFPALLDAIREAQHYVYIIGWSITPYIPLSRNNKEDLVETRLLAVLSEVAQVVPVRILLWAGAFAVFEPTAHDVREVKETIEKDGTGDIECCLDRSAHLSHCHHQKAIVIDGQIAFVGGMDITTFSGDRWDTQSHPLRAGQNWHDVQLQIRGEAVADVEHNFRQRWEASSSSPLPPKRVPHYEESWKLPVQIIRTIPAGVYTFADTGEFGIFHWYIQAIRRARRFIYIENQYIWSPHVMNALLAAMNAPHEEPFRIVIVLPAHAGDGRWDNDRHVQKLRDADKGRGIISIYSLYTSGPNTGETPFSYRAVYIHAKIAIIDDEWITIGSANLNNRGMITDSEICAAVLDSKIAHDTRIDLWAEHLTMPREKVEAADLTHLVDEEWTRCAQDNEIIIKRGAQPLTSAIHKYVVRHKPSDYVLEDAQSLTFEL